MQILRKSKTRHIYLVQKVLLQGELSYYIKRTQALLGVPCQGYCWFFNLRWALWAWSDFCSIHEPPDSARRFLQTWTVRSYPHNKSLQLHRTLSWNLPPWHTAIMIELLYHIFTFFASYVYIQVIFLYKKQQN